MTAHVTVNRVSFIVPNWNGGARLAACLQAIAAQTHRDIEVIVVDNGSSDDSVSVPLLRQPGWRCVRLDRNRGFAFATNRGAEDATGEFLALVNNDVILDPGWTAAALAALRCAPAAGAAATRVVQPDGVLLDSAGFTLYACCSAARWRRQPVGALDAAAHAPFGPVASAALYRRAAWERCGGLRPEFFCYYEDTDLAARMRLWGLETVYAHDAVAMHEASSTAGERSEFHVFHLRRNVEYCFWINMVGSLAWRYLVPHLVYEGVAFAGYCIRGQAGTVLRAKWDAFRNRGFIRQARRDLSLRLARAGRLAEGQRDLRRALAPWWLAFRNPEQIRKLRR
jgi:GT2 family glycosyltransferase